MGFYWGGGYDYKKYGCNIVTNEDTIDLNDYVAISDQQPNAGIVWQFPEYKTYLLTPYYAKQITIGATIFKNKLTGSGNTTGVVLKYIHTYEKHNKSVTLNITSSSSGTSSGSFSGSFTLSSSIDQWPLTVSVNGLSY